MTQAELDALKAAALRATQQALDAAEDLRRNERAGEVLKAKKANLARFAMEAAKAYQHGIDQMRRDGK